MLTVPMRARIASTAAPSPPFLSPRPTHRPAAIAAASVTRTSSRARLRSGAGRSARKPRPAVLVGSGLSGRGRDTGPPGTDPRPPDRVQLRAGGTGLGAGQRCGELACDPRFMTEVGPTSQQCTTRPRTAAIRAERAAGHRRSAGRAVQRGEHAALAAAAGRDLPADRRLDGVAAERRRGGAHGRPVVDRAAGRRARELPGARARRSAEDSGRPARAPTPASATTATRSRSRSAT